MEDIKPQPSLEIIDPDREGDDLTRLDEFMEKLVPLGERWKKYDDLQNRYGVETEAVAATRQALTDHLLSIDADPAWFARIKAITVDWKVERSRNRAAFLHGEL